MTNRKYKLGEWHPKSYQFNSLSLKWEKNLTQKQVSLLESGEIFVLMDKKKEPFRYIFMDSYGAIRESIVDNVKGILGVDVSLTQIGSI